jgi:hypothetical protein
LINYHLRWSLIHTLAGKHKKKVYFIIQRYGKTPKINIKKKYVNKNIISFLLPNQIYQINRGFISYFDSYNYLTSINMPIIKFLLPKVPSKKNHSKLCNSKQLQYPIDNFIFKFIYKKKTENFFKGIKI